MGWNKCCHPALGPKMLLSLCEHPAGMSREQGLVLLVWIPGKVEGSAGTRQQLNSSQGCRCGSGPLDLHWGIRPQGRAGFWPVKDQVRPFSQAQFGYRHSFGASLTPWHFQSRPELGLGPSGRWAQTVAAPWAHLGPWVGLSES